MRNKCKVPGCNDTVKARGLCNKHYLRELHNSKYQSAKELLSPTCFKGLDEGSDYFLGVLYGDGWLHIKRNGNFTVLGLKLNDEDVVRKYAQYINLSHKVRECSRNKYPYHKYWSIETCVPELIDRVLKLGLSTTKSQNQLIPKVTNPKHFIRGLLDSDGCIVKDGRVVLYVTGDIVDFIGEVLTKEEILFSKRISYKSDKVELTSINILTRNKNNIKFLNYIYEDATLYMERKHQIYLDLLSSTSASQLK